MFQIKMYNPSKRNFKRVISLDSTPETPNVCLPSEGRDLEHHDDEFSEWNGVSSDAKSSDVTSVNSPTSPAPPDERQYENSSLTSKSSSLESSQPFVDALEYQLNDLNDSIEPDNSDNDSSYELPPPLPNPWASMNDEDDDPLVNRKSGKKRNATFVLPPHGALLHPFLEWQLDEASMDKYMPEYAKQEGFAVNRSQEHKGTVIRWRCIYAGKYNGHRNLSAEVGKGQDVPMNNSTSSIMLCR